MNLSRRIQRLVHLRIHLHLIAERMHGISLHGRDSTSSDHSKVSEPKREPLPTALP
jgi:hypothetical protein